MSTSCASVLRNLALCELKTNQPFDALRHFRACPAASAQGRDHTPQAIAEAHFKAGLKLYNQENFEAARLEFLQAHAVLPRPSVLRNLALCELKTNRPIEALHHFRAYLADPKADMREFAQKNLDEAYARTGHLVLRAPEGTAVSVDGTAQGNAPFVAPIDVVAGKHAIDARWHERKVAREIDAPAGVAFEVELAFEDGRSALAAVPPVAREVAPAREVGPVVVPPAEATSSRPGWLLPAGLVALGVGVLGVGTGVYFSAAKHSTLDETPRRTATSGGVCAGQASPACRDRDAKLATATTQRSLSDAGFAIGLGALIVGAAATTTALVWPRTRQNALITPALSPTSAGAMFSRTF
jgi:hypothetical protein